MSLLLTFCLNYLVVISLVLAELSVVQLLKAMCSYILIQIKAFLFHTETLVRLTMLYSY